MKRIYALLLFISVYSTAFCTEPDPLYHSFATAYARLDTSLIKELYLKDAEVLNLYDGEPAQSLKGTAAIEVYYNSFFESFRKNHQQLVLTFKIHSRNKEGAYLLDNGFYQLEIVTPGKPSSFLFGKFSTVLATENGAWKFKTDATTNTDFKDYEDETAVPIPKREELLYAPFYDQLTGDYITTDDELIVIGRSQVRLFAYFEKTGAYRGLNKITSTSWTAGTTVLSAEVNRRFEFHGDSLKVYEQDKPVIHAKRAGLYRTENIRYLNQQQQQLAGTLFIPAKPNGKAVVLVHGSGAQDRNGYASIIRLLADLLARKGITVLTYDKQGVAASEGNFEQLGFSGLAADALAGIHYLKQRKDLLLQQTGLGGSSQAGWVIAKAIEQEAGAVDFVFTIGAAGSGITVTAQNLYNTEQQMRCAGIFNPLQIRNALTQQELFFQYISTPTPQHAKQLDRFTQQCLKDTLLKDWLFPASDAIDLTDRNQWFTTLEISFDPLPVWKQYQKPMLMQFGAYDDATPSEAIVKKLQQLKHPHLQIELLNGAQHLGLKATDICKGDLWNVDQFHPDFFNQLLQWFDSF